MVCSTCGLAEELEEESKATQKASQAKSACGSVCIFITESITYFVQMMTLKFSINWHLTIFSSVVLSGRCLPMCQLSIFRHACLQTWREGSAGQHWYSWCIDTHFWDIITFRYHSATLRPRLHIHLCNQQGYSSECHLTMECTQVTLTWQKLKMLCTV